MFHLRLSPINRAQKLFEAELLQAQKPILKTTFMPKPGVPLIIRGPCTTAATRPRHPVQPD
ncbi:MAG: hypothetical protein HC901_04195, partial [Bdellovibrionaceae bacterium]|nr:hypothetical protein [Pseudobdellovibrionaceae bacterium]